MSLALTILVAALAAPSLNGPPPGPLPLLPADNWWNQDITAAPVDLNSDAYIAFIGPGIGLHPDFGGDVSPGSAQNYGFSYAQVDATQARRAVVFQYLDECDGVDHLTGMPYPYYPIPDEAITQAHWVEGGDPGNVDLRSSDRHILVVDRDNRFLYEMWNCWYDEAAQQWFAGSGAFFDLNTNTRRPDGWTSSDAAGLAILPGLVRYDEVYEQAAEIGHAFRFTVLRTNGYVWPASHRAGNTAGALPMGARLRLKASVVIPATTSAGSQKIFRAMKQYGLINADNGSNMYISGTYDNRWDNGVLNPEFGSLHTSDFEVIQLGWRPNAARLPWLLRNRQVTALSPVTPALSTIFPLDPARDQLYEETGPGTGDPGIVADLAAPLVFYGYQGALPLKLVKVKGGSLRVWY